MHFAKEKHSFGGRCKLPSMAIAPEMNVLFISPHRMFFFRVHYEVFQTLISGAAGYVLSFQLSNYLIVIIPLYNIGTGIYCFLVFSIFS